MPRGVSSAGEVWPTTRRSGRLRKSRTKASRRRRFSISKNARIDEAGALSFINDISKFGIHPTPKEEPTKPSGRQTKTSEGNLRLSYMSTKIWLKNQYFTKRDVLSP